MRKFNFCHAFRGSVGKALKHENKNHEDAEQEEKEQIAVLFLLGAVGALGKFPIAVRHFRRVVGGGSGTRCGGQWRFSRRGTVFQFLHLLTHLLHFQGESLLLLGQCLGAGINRILFGPGVFPSHWLYRNMELFFNRLLMEKGSFSDHQPEEREEKESNQTRQGISKTSRDS